MTTEQKWKVGNRWLTKKQVIEHRDSKKDDVKKPVIKKLNKK